MSILKNRHGFYATRFILLIDSKSQQLLRLPNSDNTENSI
jgi:hypothetical protein